MGGDNLKRTPFYSFHVENNAKIVPFAGFEMPVQYGTEITEEHKTVRESVGVFDVSHMGQFEITGPDRNAFVNRLTCNDVAALDDGQAQYTALLTNDGTFIDDCIIYRFDDRIMMVVNAANIAKDWEQVVGKKGGINVRVRNISDEVALLAVQGPESEGLIDSLTRTDVTKIGYYHVEVGQVGGIDCFIARTGYTGEDGFELYFRPTHAEVMWRSLVGKGRGKPIGLGARDSLRLEMGYPLYGNDIDETINPYEARLGWIVKLTKGAPFTGKAALERIKRAGGATRKLVGYEVTGQRAIPRHGYDVYLNGRKIDIVRSGGFSPSLQIPIGTTYLPTHSTAPGTSIEIDCRGKRVPAEVVAMPFYKDGSVRTKTS
ncbi:MAG: glycine cleavage system aminomethyltransferase GcvT [Gemmatimonadales bacterium]